MRFYNFGLSLKNCNLRLLPTRTSVFVLICCKICYLRSFLHLNLQFRSKIKVSYKIFTGSRLQDFTVKVVENTLNGESLDLRLFTCKSVDEIYDSLHKVRQILTLRNRKAEITEN